MVILGTEPMWVHGQHLKYLVLDETRGGAICSLLCGHVALFLLTEPRQKRVFHLVVFKELVLPKLQLPAEWAFADPFTETHSTGRREGWRDVNLQPQAGLCDGLPGRVSMLKACIPRAKTETFNETCVLYGASTAHRKPSALLVLSNPWDILVSLGKHYLPNRCGSAS